MAKAKTKVPTASHDCTYTDQIENPPHNNVILLSCMDVRLLDDTVRFMNSLNLHNRYDHLVFAGSAMGAKFLATDVGGQPLPWRAVFFHHVDVAINALKRKVSDIFILEHLDCGAYMKLYPDEQIKQHYNDAMDVDNLVEVRKIHCKVACSFALEIEAHRKAEYERAQKDLADCLKKCKDAPLCQQYMADCHDASDRIEAWKKINVRCFIMDLAGKVTEMK